MTKTTEAVVIGGGVMGTSILYHLAARGVRGVLLEKSNLGAGGTGRSSGLIRMHYSTEVNCRLAWESFHVFKDWENRVGGQAPQFIKTGFMAIAGPDAVEGLRRNVALAKRVGVETDEVTLKEARELAPAFVFNEDEAFAWEPESGHGDPSGTAMAFAARARELGAEVLVESPVTSIETEGGRVTGARTAKETYRAPIVIVAAGPWSPRLLAGVGVDIPITCTRHEVFFIKRKLGAVATHPGGVDVTNMVYFRPEGADLTLVGNGNAEQEADPDGYNPRPTMSYLEDVWLRLAKRMPGIADGDFFTGYAGLYDSSPDEHPIVDRVDGVEGLYACVGFSGHGFKESPAVGACMAELITEGAARTVDIAPLRMGRFKDGTLNTITYKFRVIA
ncbi:MAG: FAD-binding oxidoreductase [SAR202 cluster bacterium]|nr:FAD-binding oxidoreductase [SAR202 cluster bacterium]